MLDWLLSLYLSEGEFEVCIYLFPAHVSLLCYKFGLICRTFALVFLNVQNRISSSEMKGQLMKNSVTFQNDNLLFQSLDIERLTQIFKSQLEASAMSMKSAGYSAGTIEYSVGPSNSAMIG